MYHFSVDYRSIDVSYILDMLNEKAWNIYLKIVYWLWSFDGSLAATYISLKTQPYITKRIFNYLNLVEYNEGLNYYSFMVDLNR